MAKLSELITNSDGRLSTTAFIQFFGALLMAGILAYCVYLDRPYTAELFMTFAIFCAGGAATKGFANALNRGDSASSTTLGGRNDNTGF